MSRDIYFSNKPPHLTHEVMYYNDTPFSSDEGSKDSIIILKVKTTYDLAVKSGFKGSIQDWLNSLQGITPCIEQNRNQSIEEKDTEISISEESSSEKINLISEEDINNYLNQKEENIFFQNKENILNSSDIDNLFN